VIEYHQFFSKKMVKIGFLHPDQAPTPEAARACPRDVSSPSTKTRNKTVVFLHEECMFQANDNQKAMGLERRVHDTLKEQGPRNYGNGSVEIEK
jgi:hypothetical protein